MRPFLENPELRVILLVCCMLIQGCYITPTTVRDSAYSIEKGGIQINTNALPTLSGSVGYGVTDKLDVGIDLENVISPWARYSFLNKPKGTSIAATAGIFRSAADSESINPPIVGDGKIQGIYVGGILSHSMNNGYIFNLGYRYNSLHYDAFMFDGSSWGAIAHFYNKGRPKPIAISKNDLSGIGTVSTTVSFSLKSKARIYVGVACQLYHTIETNGLNSSSCSPVLGLVSK